MTETPRIVADVPNATWLPDGGRAQVIAGGTPQAPMCLVRLLLRRGDHVFCVTRDDGTGRLDIPTQRVLDGDPYGAQTIRSLHDLIAGESTEPKYLGSVRNTVSEPGTEYPWPTPDAYFGVWESPAEPLVDGQWIDAAANGSPLRDRHWFPLLQPLGQTVRGLRALLNELDVLGVHASQGIEDEYEDLISTISHELQEGTNAEALRTHIVDALHDQYGLSNPTEIVPLDFTEHVLAWWNQHSS